MTLETDGPVGNMEPKSLVTLVVFMVVVVFVCIFWGMKRNSKWQDMKHHLEETRSGVQIKEVRPGDRGGTPRV